jgi:hypothetical protein
MSGLVTANGNETTGHREGLTEERAAVAAPQ